MVKSKNVGGTERIARLIIGAVLVVAALAALAGMVGTGTLTWTVAGIIGIVIGVVLLYTGATRYCPINNYLGITTSD